MFAAGVAIGAGWQSLVAFVNIGSYYLVGLPLAAVFGFKLKLNATVRHDMPGKFDMPGDLLAFPSSKATC
jgi:Na+-driven multidrug efflux pump